jgi:hypothetical protein
VSSTRRSQNDRVEDRLNYRFEFSKHVVVSDPKHAKPLTFEPGLASKILRESIVVTAAIEFDHDAAAGMKKIDDEAPDRELTAELLAADVAISELPPEKPLRDRHLAAQPPRPS